MRWGNCSLRDEVDEWIEMIGGEGSGRTIECQ